LAFAEAVYRLYSSRHHIKIFYSIRKVALYRGEEITQQYSKIRSRVITLKYEEDELYVKKLFISVKTVKIVHKRKNVLKDTTAKLLWKNGQKHYKWQKNLSNSGRQTWNASCQKKENYSV
jgi:hypothetical protein